MCSMIPFILNYTSMGVYVQVDKLFERTEKMEGGKRMEENFSELKDRVPRLKRSLKPSTVNEYRCTPRHITVKN